MMIIAPIIFVLLSWLSAAPVPELRVSSDDAERFDALITEYIQTITAFDLPGITLSWKTNLANEVESADRHNEQLSYFQTLVDQLKSIDVAKLEPCERLDYNLISYETRRNINRISTLSILGETAPPTGEFTKLYDIEGGAEIYRWYLGKWLTTDIAPNKIMSFGEAEITKALTDLAKLETDIIAAGTTTSLEEFIDRTDNAYLSETAVLSAFHQARDLVEQNVSTQFKSYEIAPIQIKANTNPTMSRAPGYYSGSVFYFNFDGEQYPRKDIDFLYMHEAVPGHHYQTQIANKFGACQSQLPAQFYSAFSEGWAAYIETLGSDLGLYDDFASRQGAIDWNLIRSIRVYLDVAINYEGWTSERATAYWNEKMPAHLHNLAEREIKRMHDWPAQVITYKVGADAILRLREKEHRRLGDDFDIRAFHDRLLRMGPVPLDILEQTYLNMP